MAKLFSGNTVALEELEIEKLLNQTEVQETGDKFSSLYAEVKANIDTQKSIEANKEAEEEPPQEGSDDGEDSSDEDHSDGDEGSGDDDDSDEGEDSDEEGSEDNEEEDDGDKVDGDGSDDKPDEDLKKEGEDDDKDEIVAAESMNLLVARDDLLPKHLVALEGIFTNSGLGNSNVLDNSSSSNREPLELIQRSIAGLASIGIDAGKWALPRLYKGVLYGFGKLAAGLIYSVETLDKFITRRNMALTKFKKDIAEARKILDLFESESKGAGIPDGGYNTSSVIDKLVIGDSADVTKNLLVFKDFLLNVIPSMEAGIRVDYKYVKACIDKVSANVGIDVPSLLKVDSLPYSFVPYRENTNEDHTTKYRSKITLPGDRYLCGKFPNVNIDNLDDYKEAYKNSTMYIAASKESMRHVSSIPYTNVNGLRVIIDALDDLCDTAISQKKFYTDLLSHKLHLRYTFKLYFERICASSEKKSLNDSLVEVVNMRNGFTDKMYIPTVIDCHDHLCNVMTATLQLVEKNIKALR